MERNGARPGSIPRAAPHKLSIGVIMEDSSVTCARQTMGDDGHCDQAQHVAELAELAVIAGRNNATACNWQLISHRPRRSRSGLGFAEFNSGSGEDARQHRVPAEDDHEEFLRTHPLAVSAVQRRPFKLTTRSLR